MIYATPGLPFAPTIDIDIEIEIPEAQTGLAARFLVTTD
jgi:hypothetical protein